MRYRETNAVMRTAETGLSGPVEEAVLSVIAEKTGYPEEMLEPDLDLEADLGIDSVKQAEIFGILRERYSLAVDEEVKIKDLNTIRLIVGYVAGCLQAGSETTEPAKDGNHHSGTAAPAREEVEAAVMEVVVEKTGYPQEMLEPDLDLEADLGIDSVKQAEIFGILRERYSLAVDEEVKIKDLSTIRLIVEYVAGRLSMEPEAGNAPAKDLHDLLKEEEGSIALRYLPQTIEREYVGSEGKELFSLRDKRILLIADGQGQVASYLIPLLRERGSEIFVIAQEGVTMEGVKTFPADFDNDSSLEAAVAAARQKAGRIEVVINLCSLANETSFFEADAELWERELERQFNLNFFVARGCYADLEGLEPGKGGYFAATAIGGVFGLEASAGIDPLGAVTSGFIKSLQKELPKTDCKAVDFPVHEDPEKIAETLLREMELREEYVEIGYTGGIRKIIQVLPVALEDDRNRPVLSLDEEKPVIISGGGRGIVAECVKGLAKLSQAPLVITGRTPMPQGDEEWLSLDEEEFSRYRLEYMKRLKKENPSLTPVLIERESRKLVHGRELFSTLQEIRSLTPHVWYEVCDVSDREQVQTLTTMVRDRLGPIQGVIHGAGLESFGAVPKKPLEHSRNVVRVKVKGYRNLWEATRDEPLRFFAHFGSMSGRFGMDGQVDYCAAAQTAAVCSFIQARRDEEARVFSLEWTAWAEKGMASIESVRRAQEGQRGLAYMGVKEGVNKFLRELFLGGDSPEVMFFGELGMNSSLGQLESLDEKRTRVNRPVGPDGVFVDRIRFPLIERISAYHAGEAVTAEKELTSLEDLYLADHLVEGAPTFPGVLHIESHCQAAALLCPDLHLAYLRNVAFLKFVKHYERNPLCLRINSRIDTETEDEVTVTSAIRSDFVNSRGMVLERDRLHSQGTYVFQREKTLPPQAGVDGRELWEKGREMDLEKFYRLASPYITFGPTFRSLQGVRYIAEGELISETLVPFNRGLFSSIPAPQFLIAPIVIDNACRSTLLWSFHTTGDIVVPREIHETRLYRTPFPGERVYSHVRLMKQEGDLSYFQVALIDESKHVLMDMPSLAMVRINSENGDTKLL